VTVLGTGIMGAGMTRSLLREGLDFTVWNRSTDKAKPLAEDGATVAETAAQAVSDADVVVTMLFDTDAVEQTMTEALDHVPDGAVWVQTSTVGVDGTARLAELARSKGVDFLDAPVLGTKAPAENGKLVVLASGPSRLQDEVRPVLDAIGAKTQWIGEEPGDSSKLKLAVNAWIATVVNGTAQSIALTRALGLDPQQFLDAVSGQAVDAPYVQLKGKAMIDGDYAPSFELDGVIKDVDLVLAAARDAGVDTTLTTALRDRLQAASGDGHGSEDMAAVVHAYQVR
jgi:3-hydroxyisobutyrate dehydrogenase